MRCVVRLLGDAEDGFAGELEIHHWADVTSVEIRICWRAATSASIIASVCFGPGVRLA